MNMIIRRSKTTGNVKSITDYEPATFYELDRIYNNTQLSTCTVEVVDIPESAFESHEKYGRIVKKEYIRDVLEKAE